MFKTIFLYVGSSPFKHPVTPGNYIFKIKPRGCVSHSVVRLEFEVAANGSMIDPDITYHYIT